jgi:hypothetical protein
VLKTSPASHIETAFEHCRCLHSVVHVVDLHMLLWQCQQWPRDLVAGRTDRMRVCLAGVVMRWGCHAVLVVFVVMLDFSKISVCE